MIEDVSNFDITTTPDEKDKRLALCGSCEENKEVGERQLCMKCACPIDYVVTYKFKICPLNKWDI